MSASVTDNSALQRYELTVEGETAFLTYERTPDSIRLLHTEVPGTLRGRGFGQTLVKGVLDRAHADGLRVVAVCPFVRGYLEKHRARQD